MYIVREAGTPAKNLLISVAGPLTNVVLILLFWRASHMFALANLCLAVCNLAPIKGSDGDRALGCLQQIQKELAPATESN
jgi:Zn-dependent protease